MSVIWDDEGDAVQSIPALHSSPPPFSTALLLSSQEVVEQSLGTVQTRTRRYMCLFTYCSCCVAASAIPYMDIRYLPCLLY